jgi:hypothetical protein
MKSKKGFLLAEETLKIVIAIICLVFLVGLLVKIYYNSTYDEELEKAEASLEHLIDEIDSGNEYVEIYNPEGWFITSFPIKGDVKKEMPSECSSKEWKNCLCICKPKKIIELVTSSNLREACENKGICKGSDYSTEGENTIRINSPPLILNINGSIITQDESR